LTINKNNENPEYLLDLTRRISEFNVEKSDLFIYCKYLSEMINHSSLKETRTNFGVLAKWLRRVDESFQIIHKLDILDLWNKRHQFELEELSSLMYELNFRRTKTNVKAGHYGAC